MSNYQLYRTNTKLGGQMRWDVILKSHGDALMVSDFHLSPVSDRVPYNRVPNENLLLYPHLENIKTFYNSIQSSFYKDYANPLITAPAPMVVDDDYDKDVCKVIDNHDDTLEYGLRRMPYSVYNKQFSVFCPLWLDNYTYNTKDGCLSFLSFCLTLYTRDKDTKHVLTKKYIKFTDEGVPQSHSKFVKYFNDFEESIDGSNNSGVINIDFANRYAVMRGIDVKGGTYVNCKDISNKINDLLNTEMLLMDADSLIIDNFMLNHMISSQLLNLNFVFDIDDLVPLSVVRNLTGTSIGVDINVTYNGVQLPMKDFYSNYEFIPSKPAFNTGLCDSSDQSINIFKFINDPSNIDLKLKNKVSQNIIHWSHVEDNEYIFNLYSGFGGYTSPAKVDGKTSLFYQNMTNVYQHIYSESTSAMNWLNIIKAKSVQDVIYQINYTTDGYGDIGGLTRHCGGLIFNPTKHGDDSDDSELDTIYKCRVFVVKNNDFATLSKRSSFQLVGGSEKDGICCNINTNQVNIIISESYIQTGILMFYEFLHKNWTGGDKQWGSFTKNIQTWMKTVISPRVYSLTPLLYGKAPGPSGATEVNHYIADEQSVHIYRYDGQIRPSFVDLADNVYYTKKMIKAADAEGFSNVSDIYDYKYESIGYYPWDKHNFNESDPTKREFEYPIKCLADYEYRFFGNNQMLVLTPMFTCQLADVTVTKGDNGKITYTISDQQYESVAEMIKKCILSRTYPSADVDMLNYIYNKYSISADWKYVASNNIFKYTYTITFVLK